MTNVWHTASGSHGDAFTRQPRLRSAIVFALRWPLLCGVLCAIGTFSCVAVAQQAPMLAARSAASPAIQLTAEVTTQPAISSYPGESGFVSLTGSERTSLFFKGYLGEPSTYLTPLVEAGASQLAGEPEGWPRSFNGFNRRSGTALMLNTVEAGIHNAGDAALRLDPRYFRCRCSGGWRRSWYAFKMTALAYDGDGHARLDLPRFAGDYAGSMLVTTWYPSPYSPLVQGVKMGHTQLGTDFAFNLLREFSPEMKRFLRKFRLP